MEVKLTLTVNYENEDGSTPDEGECHGLLEHLARLAANRGLLTGESPDLIAEEWHYDVTTVSDESRRELLSRLLAGVETPDDLTPDEIQHWREDLEVFLQKELNKYPE